MKKEISEILIKNKLKDFKWIDAKNITVAQWVRVKCQFGCSDYGLGTCPPNSPSVQECERFFKEYKNAVLIRINKTADKNNYPSDWSKEMTKKLLEIERQVFLAGNHKVFLFNQTCCGICKDCSGDRLNCKDKKQSRPSLEAFAVDVYKTVRDAGLEINVVANNPSEMNRYAILMVD